MASLRNGQRHSIHAGFRHFSLFDCSFLQARLQTQPAQSVPKTTTGKVNNNNNDRLTAFDPGQPG